MRGDVALTARLLLRGSGLAGLAVAAGGGLAVFAATEPWYHAMAEVEMLGADQARAIASLLGVQTVGGWVSLVVGAGAVVLGIACALDRPPARARPLLLGGAVVLVLAAASAWLLPAPALDSVTGAEADQLAVLADRLPVGLALELQVRVAAGPALVALGSAIVAGGTFFAREL